MNNPTIDDLKTRRQQLAYEAAKGNESANKELIAVEKQLASLELAAERQRLATAEGHQRATAEAELAAAEERIQLEAEHDLRLAERTIALAGVQQAIIDLVTFVDTATEIDAECRAAASRVGRHHGVGANRLIDTFLQWKLAEVGAGAWPIAGLRSPLVTDDDVARAQQHPVVKARLDKARQVEAIEKTPAPLDGQ